MENLRNRLYKLSKVISLMDGGIFEIPVEKQMDFLQGLDEPNDYIERSYLQYKCQRWLKKRWVNVLADICSIPLLIYYLLKSSNTITEHVKSNIYLAFGHPNTVIPLEAKEKYGCIKSVNVVGDYLSDEDKSILKELIKRYPFSPEFILKCLIKVRMYSWSIKKFNPDVIFVSEEFSYTSSFLTYYCNKMGIDHVCLMHGEKLYYIRDSFFLFNKFYVWDNYYVNLFSELRAPVHQFVVVVPPVLRLQGDRDIKYDYTYYLGGESVKDIENLVFNLKILSELNYKVNVRPHPRYTEESYLNLLKDSGIGVENPQLVSIEKSLLSTRNVISLYSTVINQAICNGIGVVIDDITSPHKYKKLIELKYRFVGDRRVKLLSSIIRK